MLFTAEMLYELDSFTAFFFHNFQHSQTGITMISFSINPVLEFSENYVLEDTKRMGKYTNVKVNFL